jgi:hypothetical protein
MLALGNKTENGSIGKGRLELVLLGPRLTPTRFIVAEYAIGPSEADALERIPEQVGGDAVAAPALSRSSNRCTRRGRMSLEWPRLERS